MKINEVSIFSDSQFLEKMYIYAKLPKPFANCEFQMANLNPDILQWNILQVVA